ncbi:MAG: type II toxin-antitoxin system VapC family toxin [Alphaproteobacteria bacterium]
MVVDSSAILAILLNEAERHDFNVKIAADPVRLLSAANAVETGIVLERRYGETGAHDFDLFLFRASIEIVPFDAEQATLARLAFRRYGRGRHRAGLNMGDCFAYALAKATGEPLLYKGGDFAHTDVESC